MFSKRKGSALIRCNDSCWEEVRIPAEGLVVIASILAVEYIHPVEPGLEQILEERIGKGTPLVDFALLRGIPEGDNAAVRTAVVDEHEEAHSLYAGEAAGPHNLNS